MPLFGEEPPRSTAARTDKWFMALTWTLRARRRGEKFKSSKVQEFKKEKTTQDPR
jgi:hypothetical protein